MTNDNGRAADRIVSEALARYSDAEPLAGIEERILNRVRAEAGARRAGLWLWALAAALAAGCFLVLAYWPSKTPQAMRRPPVEVARGGAPVAHAAPRIEARRTRPRHRAWRPFPTPAPISPEERALLALTDAPAHVRDALIEKQEIEEIRIEPLKIEPLK